jgi:hypothetical protein
MLITFLKTSRGIPFDKMFAMREYPRDIMPLYAQGYATARFLIAQGGKREFVKFMESGFEREDWAGAIKKHYGYNNLAELQDKWLAWIREGGSNTVSEKFAGRKATPPIVLASNTTQPAGQTQAAANSGIMHEAAADPVVTAQTPPQASRPQPVANTASAAGGWYSRASRGEVAREPATAPIPTSTPPVTRDVAHPQPIEPARQIILEWNRPAGEAQATTPTSAGPLRTSEVSRGTVLR